MHALAAHGRFNLTGFIDFNRHPIKKIFSYQTWLGIDPLESYKYGLNKTLSLF